jgi:hypothetical protein
MAFMEATEIEVNKDYACLLPAGAGRPNEPLRATVLDEPQSGCVKVLLHHPDTGTSEEEVRTRELVGSWDDVPEERFVQHHADIAWAREHDVRWTWAKVAEKRHELVRRQRALAARLNAVGVVRAPAHYAGAGGASSNSNDVKLQLNYDELELLLAKAEGGLVPLPAGNGARA